MMDETQVQVKKRSESKTTAEDSPATGSTLKSRFDDAEYARWVERLRASRTKSK